MKNPAAAVVWLLAALAACAQGARILAFFPTGGSSHYNAAEALLKALAARGHNVTSITSLPQKRPLPNFRDVDVSGARPASANSLPFEFVRTRLQSTYNNFYTIANVSRAYCEIAFANPRVREVLREPPYDLVVTEIFGADCGVGFAWAFGAPLVSVLPPRHTTWAFARVGNPSTPSYMRMAHSSYPPRMSFRQRLENAYWQLYYDVFYYSAHNGEQTNRLSRGFFGADVPPVNEIVYNTSLVLANSHYVLGSAYPMVPNYVEVAGIHVKKPKPLPKDLQTFMDEAKDGVIYFTLGSLVRVSTMPKETLKAFRDAFAEVPQKVLWKFELELEDAPPNVFISKWFPQIDIFNHSNLIAYISHGGNSGSIEAVYFGIPMIGIPLFYDQHSVIQNFVDKGVAVRLDLHNLTKENILSAIRTVVNDKGYRERMKKLSELFHDRPMSPLETAVYWTEYVIRHKGAPHLRSVGASLPWYEYLLLDVIGFCLFVIFVVLYALKLVLKRLLSLVKSNASPKKVKKN